jgi:hypothetical protein
MLIQGYIYNSMKPKDENKLYDIDMVTITNGPATGKFVVRYYYHFHLIIKNNLL